MRTLWENAQWLNDKLAEGRISVFKVDEDADELAPDLGAQNLSLGMTAQMIAQQEAKDVSERATDVIKEAMLDAALLSVDQATPSMLQDLADAFHVAAIAKQESVRAHERAAAAGEETEERQYPTRFLIPCSDLRSSPTSDADLMQIFRNSMAHHTAMYVYSVTRTYNVMFIHPHRDTHPHTHISKNSLRNCEYFRGSIFHQFPSICHQFSINFAYFRQFSINFHLVQSSPQILPYE